MPTTKQEQEVVTPEGDVVDAATGEIVDRRQQESDALDLDPQGWRPDPGKKLWGWVVYATDVPSDFPPGHYPMVQVLSDGGELINVHCFHSVMRAAVDRYKPAYGDRFGVKYKGRKTSGGFNDEGYEDYNVIVIPQDRIPLEERPRLSLPAPSEIE